MLGPTVTLIYDVENSLAHFLVAR